jgi:predicted DNA-binding protein YlxM (UPF0122 family)
MAKKLPGKKKDKGGRELLLTDELRVKIEEVAALDGTVEEMAYYCDVSRQTIYNWFKLEPDLFDKVERLRLRPILLARQTINKEMKKSYSNAIDYLKRKKRLEFGDNIDVTTLGKELPKPIYGGISKHNSNQENISA